MAKKLRTRRYRNVVRAVHDSPWAILPAKLDEICQLLELRSQVVRLSRGDIQSRIGMPPAAMAAEEGSKIAVLNLFGVMSQRLSAMQDISGGMSAERAAAAVRAAAADPDVRAIVLNIDSPGGSVFGVEELGDAVFAARQEKTVKAVVNARAFSAAYWIASQADEVIITPSGMAGSIGVLMVHHDTSEADAKEGIRTDILRVPDAKAEGVAGEPLSEAARSARMKLAATYYDRFVAAVARGRGVSEQAVRTGFGQGREVAAEEAVAQGLADRVGTFEDVLREFGAGIRAAPAGSGDEPAFALEFDMDPKIFGLLVRLGLCEITASESVAQNALARFFAAKDGSDPPEDAAKVVEALQAHVKQAAATTPPPVADRAPTPPTVTSVDAEEILAAVRLATGIPAEERLDFASSLIQAPGMTLSKALKAISDKAAEVQANPGPSPLQPGAAERDKFYTEARTAVLTRAFGGAAPEQIWSRREQDYEPFQAGRRNYRLQGLLSLAEECLVQDGYSQQDLRNLAPFQLAQLAMGVIRPQSAGIFASSDGPMFNTSGMFSNILLDAANVMMRRSYDDSRTTFQAWMRQGDSLRDFKLTHKVVAGELSDPKAIPEDGEFEETTLSDAKEAYRLTVWGEIFSIAWQAVVNDQLSAFTEVPAKQGRAMRRKQNRLAYGVLKDNAAMADAKALFHADHSNLTTGAGAPSVSTLNTLSQKMMEQKGLNTNADGSAILNILPRWILAPPALRGTVLELLGSGSMDTNGNANRKNIWENGLDPVIEGELAAASTGGSDVAWYLVADSNDIDTLEYAYLQGLETPVIEQEAAFDRLGFRTRIYQAFAVHALEFRGLQKHAGV